MSLSDKIIEERLLGEASRFILKPSDVRISLIELIIFIKDNQESHECDYIIDMIKKIFGEALT